MESIDPLWVFGGIAFVCGGLLGVLLCRRFTPGIREVDELRVKLERSRAEMEDYRESVNDHFSKTSNLVRDLTEDYVKVYRHLSEGAQTLSDAPKFSHVLEQQKGRVLISTDEDSGLPDIEGVKPEPVSTEDEKAADTPPEPESSAAPADENREAKTAAGVSETAEPGEEAIEKTPPGSTAKPEPVARTDTQ